jgi:hypothetical protein
MARDEQQSIDQWGGQIEGINGFVLLIWDHDADCQLVGIS